MTKEDREALIQNLKATKKKYYCTKCEQKMTVLVSLSCNCGGSIIPIKD